VDDPEILLIHVTHFNRLMWDNHNVPVRVIEHGVTYPSVKYTGEKQKGLVVINNLPSRGRLLGLDIFNEVKKQVPIDLVGMGSQEFGLGEVLHPQLPSFQAAYRFFFHPIRYTSLGLAVCEAMMLGIPVVGLATTELSAVIHDGVDGFIHTDITYLIDKMKQLIEDKELAFAIGKAGQKTARDRFNIERFTNDWQNVFAEMIGKGSKQKIHPVLQ
jgi:glycosyltransferase involved in cell wall biosynthesis